MGEVLRTEIIFHCTKGDLITFFFLFINLDGIETGKTNEFLTRKYSRFYTKATRVNEIIFFTY